MPITTETDHPLFIHADPGHYLDDATILLGWVEDHLGRPMWAYYATSPLGAVQSRAVQDGRRSSAFGDVVYARGHFMRVLTRGGGLGGERLTPEGARVLGLEHLIGDRDLVCDLDHKVA